jgi:putative exosortase-associated protein (TIGR04073 family)
MNFKHLACLAALFMTIAIARADIVYPTDRADRNFNTTVTEKLDRGVSNVLLFWLEIPRAWTLNSDRDRYNSAGFFKGTADGVRNAGVRLGQGIFDTFTFPANTGNFELPWDPPPPRLHPEFVPAIEWMIPGAIFVDEYIGDGVDGWEGQFYP